MAGLEKRWTVGSLIATTCNRGRASLQSDSEYLDKYICITYVCHMNSNVIASSLSGWEEVDCAWKNRAAERAHGA